MLAALAILWFLKNKKRKRAEAAAWTETQGGYGGGQPQHDHKYPAEMLVPNQQIPAEVWGQPNRVEIGSEPVLAEMGSVRPPVELPSENSRWSHRDSPTAPPYYD